MRAAASSLLNRATEEQAVNTWFPLCAPMASVVIALAFLGNCLMKAFRLGLTILREIFDETAYDRFLSRHHEQASVNSYAAFRRDHELQTSRRPRCC